MKRHSFRRTVTTAIAIAVFLGAVTGCGSDGDEATTAVPTPSASAAGGEALLPINAYTLTTLDIGRMGRARTLLAGSCMRRFGFEFDPQGAGPDGGQSQVKDVGVYGNLRRYGVTDPAAAARYGYHLASTVTGEGSASTLSRSDHGLGELTSAKQAVLFGKTADGKALTQVGGRPLPDGGCLGEARSKIATAGELTEAAVVSRISAESFQRSRNDPAVVAAIGQWSACMKSKGYTYPNPLEAAGAFDLDNPTVQVKETATAKADVECKRQVKLVDVWTAFEVRYQKSQIEQHAEELQRIRAERDEQIKRVSEIVSAGS
jgi:hypothetical protein